MGDWLEAEQRAEKAQQLLESERWPEALDELKAAIAINPHNAEWHGNLGYLFDQLDRHDDARTAYRRAVDLEPDNVEWLVALGLDLTRLGELDEAVELFERVAELEPSNELAYCQRTAIFAYTGEHDRAEETFYLAQQLKPDCPHCFYHLGTSLAERESWDRAIYCWTRVLEISPTYRGANQRLAEACRARGDTEAAKRHYVAELRLDPGNVDVLLAFGCMLLDTDSPPEEVRMKFRQILELDPDHVGARLGMAQLAMVEQAEPSAEIAPMLAEVLARDPMNGPAHRLMAQYFMRREQYADARTHLTKALAVEPEDKIALMTMGNCLAKLDCPRLASTYFERLLALEPDALGPRHNLAVCYFAQARFEDGIRECLQTLERDERYVPAMHKLALAYARLGRWSEARAMVRRGLAIEPQHAELRRFRSRLRWFRPIRVAARFGRVLKRVLPPWRRPRHAQPA